MFINLPPIFLPIALAGGLALSGCTVGPDYRGAPDAAPDALHQPAFVRTPRDAVTAGPPISQWWLGLNDAQLNTLIEQALAHNPDVHAAQARLRASRAQLQQATANGMPTVGALGAAVRTRSPNTSLLSQGGSSNQGDGGSGGDSGGGSSGRGPVQFYTAGFDASWELDLFGGTRRAVEAASAEADAVQADLADTQVSLAAEVAQAYVSLRDEQQRLVLAQRSAELQQRMLDLTQQRRARGTAADVDVDRLSTQVSTTRATLVPLEAQIDESLDRLAVLTGREPGALDQELTANAPLPALPGQITVGDPAAMLKQRPDIRGAERRLASANAQIGEQTADLFPKVTLFGDIGFNATTLGHLARKENFSWIGVPYLQWNVLDFGRTRGAIHAAEASRDEAEAKYEHTVLAALQDANTALSRYGHQREHLVRLRQVQDYAERSAELTRQRYSAGVATLIDLLDTQRSEFAAQQDVVAGQAELLQDFVSLQKSLGLGWQEAGATSPTAGAPAASAGSAAMR
ncbi:MAG TPA: efflux transporter outer membrane subunit [Bordetella sp.]|jgi:NodT family efflux transporter outer membrane factor (OMF) lipoprotein|nr:efflux transporter outer membrane subunit [Bordetella sp.]